MKRQKQNKNYTLLLILLNTVLAGWPAFSRDIFVSASWLDYYDIFSLLSLIVLLIVDLILAKKYELDKKHSPYWTLFLIIISAFVKITISNILIQAYPYSRVFGIIYGLSLLTLVDYVFILFLRSITRSKRNQDYILFPASTLLCALLPVVIGLLAGNTTIDNITIFLVSEIIGCAASSLISILFCKLTDN